LLTKADVRARVADLQAKAAKAAIVTRASLIMEAAEIQQLAVRNKQFRPAITALTAKAKLAREWPSKGEMPQNQADAVSQLSNEELLQSLVEEARAIGIDARVTEMKIGPTRRGPRLVNGR
jgi:cell division inhibitor SulA